MNTTITKIDPQKVHLLANISKILRETKKNVSVFPSGRRISAAHKGVMHGLVELWIIHYTNTGSAVLRTNRGNLADAMLCSERSTYNYMKDFNQLDILQWKVITEDDRGWIDIELTFLPAMFAEPVPMGERATDGGNAPAAEPNGVYSKVCRTQYTTEINNKENSHRNGGQLSDNAVSVQKIEAEQKKEKQGQQKAVKSADANDQMSINPNFSAAARALPADEFKELEYYANLLWKQARKSLWAGRGFRLEVQTDCITALATTLLYEAQKNQEQRRNAVKYFCATPAYQMAGERKKAKMQANFMMEQPIAVTAPFKAAFLMLHRAVEIQRENCQKRGYQCYYPTFYLTEYYHVAVKCAKTEQRTMATHQKANALRRDHCAAKLKLQDYLCKSVGTLRKFGFNCCMHEMRIAYKEFRAWLETTQVPDKQIYLTHFVEQMNCLK